MSAAPAFRAMIVDDEPLAREAMVNAIRRLAVPIAVASVCENAVVALEAINAVGPDILLLDVAMPVLDGFAMLERLEPEATPPAIIFITAYDEHAVQAFAAEALDFLVKPVSDERLRASLERAMRRIGDVRALRASLDHRPLLTYTYLAILASGARAPVSRERVSSLRERLKQRESKRD